MLGRLDDEPVLVAPQGHAVGAADAASQKLLYSPRDGARIALGVHAERLGLVR